MADISKIQIESGTYNIKDVVARQQIAGLSNLSTKYTKMLTFGDSWTGDSLNNDGTGTLANPSCNWASLLADTLGLTLENYAIGGYAVYGIDNTLRIEIERAVNNISVDDRDQYKYIFVMIGVNDWQGSASPSTLMTTTINDLTYLKTCFPKSQIVFIPLNFFSETLDIRAHDLYSAFLTAANYCNVSLIPNFYNYLNTFGNFFYKDESSTIPSHPYAHPNDDGHKMIKTLIAGALNGKCYPMDMPLVLDTTARTTPNVYVSKYVCTTNTEYFSLNAEITIKSGTTIDSYTYYNVGRFTYGNENVYVSRYTEYTDDSLPYHDSFADLLKNYELLVYLTKDGQLVLVCKTQFTAGGDITIKLNSNICRII